MAIDEIPLGWRRLRDTEQKQSGDKCRIKNGGWSLVHEGHVMLDPNQIEDGKPYIRPLDDEWHEHDGGEMPVNGEEVVEVGSAFNCGRAKHFAWTNANHPNPVQRYRRNQTSQKPQPLTEPHVSGTTMETPEFSFLKRVEITGWLGDDNERFEVIYTDDGKDQVFRLPHEVSAADIPHLIKALEMLLK